MQKNKQAVLLLLLTLSFLLSTSCKRVNQTKITTANGDDTSEVVDSTPPTNPSISINSGSSLTSITIVTLTLSATDASQMYVSNTAGCVIGGSWEAYNTTKSWTLGQTNTVATVYVKYRDSSSNESSCASASITHDNTSPSGESISINSGAFVASSTSVTLTLAASDAAEMYVTNTLGCDSDGTWEAYNTSKAWTLGQSNAPATVYVKFRDEALNESTCANDDITHDNIAPPGGTISINGGAIYTTTTAVTLTLGATGASQMYITNTSGCGSDGSWENYNTSKAWTLGQTNVVATSYVKYRDEALNETSCYSAAIIHDNTPPIGGSIAINGGDASTSSTSVTVTLSATGASQMYVTNTSGCASGGALESYATSKAWTLGQTNGTATVYVKYRDDAGNETACLSDAITHDNTAPTGGSIAINSGDASTTSTSVTLTLSATGASQMYITNTSGCASGGALENYATSKAWTLAQTNATATVYVKYRDDAGNESSCVSDSIVHSSGDSWTATSTASVPSARIFHTAIWTGSKMIIWGGGYAISNGSNTGGLYDPITDSWADTTTTNAPPRRNHHTAVWTGSKMIVWGGHGYTDGYMNTGGIYDPVLDSWTITSTGANVPSVRYYHTAVWSGSKMIVWGGLNGETTGGIYNPEVDSWTPTSTTGAPGRRWYHSAVWTGSKMIIWGGWGNNGTLNTGGIYDVSSNSWASVTTTGAPAPQYQDHTAVWTGAKMLVWIGGWGNRGARGGEYDPVLDSWTTISTDGAPGARIHNVSVWTGSKMIIWGGSGDGGSNSVNTGALYDPVNGSWVSMTTTNAPSAEYATAVWTGSKMIVWGGEARYLSSGGVYTPPASPTSNSWTATTTTGAPAPRSLNAAVWTGSKMIVWGGSGSNFFNTGGQYDPLTDSWTVTNTTGAPSSRGDHVAVWSGAKMIIWGGGDSASSSLNTGGLYDPVADLWTSTSTTSAPHGRSQTKAVWTGKVMLVWGGDISESIYPGGSYLPDTDTWVTITNTNAPSDRYGHSAVWTGSKMIVWGGYYSPAGSLYGNGGLYDPETNVWTTVSTTGAPSARRNHTAVFTGSKMIIWGGVGTDYFSDGALYDPITNTWTATSTTNAPTSRELQSAIWSGGKMLIWGGYRATNLNSGGQYDPFSDSWTSITTTGAPEARARHSAVWTGSKMIVFGGGFNTGGQYDP